MSWAMVTGVVITRGKRIHGRNFSEISLIVSRLLLLDVQGCFVLVCCVSFALLVR